jgi:pimeloyl-ACP methyl ester carboxylesterase
VVPDQALPGRPWIWRGEFFGAFANADEELVRRGFHLAYLSIKDRFGSPETVAAWDRFHTYVRREWLLAEKPALIGLSRGGLYCFNWAIAHPTKVACIYADAPVCDFKSWPGGAPKQLGAGRGSSGEWEKLRSAYGFADDAAAIAWKGNPVDSLAPLATESVPLLLVYGDADDIVPWPENGALVATRYQALGGLVQIIAKPGVGHHPHGLTDPSPIVDFILRHALSASDRSSRPTPP